MSPLRLPALACFFILISFASRAQDEPRCATTEYRQQLLLQNPSLAEQIKKQESELQYWIAKHGREHTRNVITIPVVVHLVYNPDVNMVLSDWQVKSQIDVLNEDFRRVNADRNKTPSDFTNVASDTEIQFCLAKRDPNGNSTTGIVREMYNNLSSWDMGSFDFYKSTYWPPDQYMNIWVAKLSGGVLGFSSFPGDPPYTDGVVITDTAFGRIGNLKFIYNLGRSGTHEVGHWLSLYHIWGDDGDECTATDYCGDTPNQAGSNNGCPTHPSVSCSNNGDMFMNYLDYVHDSCMNIFSGDQKDRMVGTLNTERVTILTSPGCNAPQQYDYDIAVTDILTPAISVNQRYINPVVNIANYGFQPITDFTLYYHFYKQDTLHYDWTGTLQPGETIQLTLPQIRDSLGYNFFVAYARNVNEGTVTELDTVNNFASRSFFVDPSLINNENKLKVYYEPGNSSFDLEFDLLVYKNFTLDVFNVLGQYVPYDLSIKSQNLINVDLGYAIPGFYFVRAINDGKKLTSALIKMPSQ